MFQSIILAGIIMFKWASAVIFNSRSNSIIFAGTMHFLAGFGSAHKYIEGEWQWTQR